MGSYKSSCQISRRTALASLGAGAAGLALLDEAVAEKENPAAQVVDRGSSLKITDDAQEVRQNTISHIMALQKQ